MRGESTLTRGERELIAAYVSALNECRYCSSSHAAYAAAQLPGGMALVEQVCADAGAAPIPAKLKALLVIAAAVQQSGLKVSEEQVTTAREAGATDGDPRHGADRGGVLHVQPLCRRAGHDSAGRPRPYAARAERIVQ